MTPVSHGRGFTPPDTGPAAARVGNPMGTRKYMNMELLREMDREIRYLSA